MNKQNILFIGFILIVALLLFNHRNKLQDEVKNSFQTLAHVEKDGVLLNDLRGRWENKKNRKKVIRFLRNFNPRPKVKTRGDKTTFIFEAMDKNRLNKLSKKILQSTIKIRKFTIEKVDKHNAILKLEVDK